MYTRDMVWAGVVVILALMGSVTALIFTGRDYNGIIVLLSTVVIVCGQLVNLTRTHGVSQQLTDVQLKVNGKMTALMQAAGVLPPDESQTPQLPRRELTT
jgi:hypothetical protein